jgi:hypothetical protein
MAQARNGKPQDQALPLQRHPARVSSTACHTGDLQVRDPGLGPFHQPSRAFPDSEQCQLAGTEQPTEYSRGTNEACLLARSCSRTTDGWASREDEERVVNTAARHQDFGRTLKRTTAGTGPYRSALGMPDARKRGFVGRCSLCHKSM